MKETARAVYEGRRVAEVEAVGRSSRSRSRRRDCAATRSLGSAGIRRRAIAVLVSASLAAYLRPLAVTSCRSTT